MNADIKRVLEYYKHKKISILETDKGELIPSKEAKEYLRWCLKHGYEELKDAPEWDEYLKLKEK